MHAQALKRMHTVRNAAVTILGIVLFLEIQPVARADSIAYMETGNLTVGTTFGTIDLTTGLFTQLGSLSQDISSLGVAGGDLYGGVEGGSTLYLVNPATGALTAVGTGSVTYMLTGSTTTGLYALGTNFDLYSINPSNGAATEIGPTGITSQIGVEVLSTGSGVLYFTNGPNFYSLNTTTGVATLIGNSGQQIGAMVFENGVLYAGSYVGGSLTAPALYTVDTATAGATFVTNLSGAPAGSPYFYALAPYPLTATPEPAPLLLLGTALVGLVALVRHNW